MPKTTYEGLVDTSSDHLRHLSAGSSGFSRATFVAGQRITCLQEQYLLGAVLGRGATSTVYRAVSVRTRQIVAVKAIQKRFVGDTEMFLNEIQIHKAADHPNILRLLETFEDDKMLYLVTELCEHGDLSRYLEFDVDNPDEGGALMPERDALLLFQQVVASIRYLHQRGIVHRDLKPGNFLCSGLTAPSAVAGWDNPDIEFKSIILKLADFGVSASCGSEKHMLTKKVGTDGFMAPEVIRSQPYNEKSDIFSIGCILHMLLTGSPPKWQGSSYELDSSRLETVSAEVRHLVDSLLQARPEDRPSAEELSLAPLLNQPRHQLQQTSSRLDTQFLDRIYAYSSFPLLKRAAIVAMVSRAESDADFVPSIEKFMSIGRRRNMNSGINIEDIYESLVEEVSSERQCLVRQALQRESGIPRTPRRQIIGLRGDRRKRTAANALATQRFQQDLRRDLEQLIFNIDAAGALSYSEWLAATVEPSWYMDPNRIAAIFGLFDQDQDGWISIGDLKGALPDVFHRLSVDDVLQESQLSARQSSWISKENFSRLIRTQNHSLFTLKRVAECIRDDPLLPVQSLHPPQPTIF
jgi:serine/threonine protein kinase